MPYPEAGATHKYEPKFVERMRDGENAPPSKFPNPSTAELINAHDEMKRGMEPFTAGAGSGPGRLEKMEHMQGEE